MRTILIFPIRSSRAADARLRKKVSVVAFVGTRGGREPALRVADQRRLLALALSVSRRRLPIYVEGDADVEPQCCAVRAARCADRGPAGPEAGPQSGLGRNCCRRDLRFGCSLL